MKKTLFDKTGKEIGSVNINEKVFEGNIDSPVVWETITALQSSQRHGLASTKNKAEVQGSGKKPYRQKGIGWARHGTVRSPIWRGGGVVFGPKPRDYSVRIPKKKKQKALVTTLAMKVKEDRIRVIDDLSIDEPKTKHFVEILKNNKLENIKTLVGVENIEKNLKLASRNIPYIRVKRVLDINCLDILSAEYLLITKKGLENLEKRCATKKL